MMFSWLLLALASAIILCFIPFGERALRNISLSMSTVAAVLGGYVVVELWKTNQAFGYADMWWSSASTVTALILVLASSLLIQCVAYQRFAKEHLEGPLSLPRLRLHLSALHGMTLAAIMTSMANNLWIALAGIFISVIVMVLATDMTKRKIIALFGVALLFVGIALGFMRGGVLDWDNLTFSNLLSAPMYAEWAVRAAWGGALLVLGALAGFAPFGSVFTNATQSASIILRASARSVLVIASTVTFLRLTFVTNIAFGSMSTGNVLLAVGLFSAVWAIVTLWQNDSNAMDARFAFLAACT
ncbi:MAG: hypothetical protein NUV56_01760, partial [Candidatus Uhrbacteria bacterium]|nr:hypothetical protein [Candidatus Uhrbacteria bacterium]